MRNDRQEIALRVGGDMSLAALDPLARIVAALLPFCRVFTLWLSMIATVGSGSRPALIRTWRRKWWLIAAQVPALRKRQKVMYTARQGGKSFGNIRHWQPLRSTYRIALYRLRTGCLRGRPICSGSKNRSISAHSRSLTSLGYLIALSS